MISDTYYILDSKNNPVKCSDIKQWGEWFNTPNNRRVSKTNIGTVRFMYWLGRLFRTRRFEPVIVSTVFLGIDHNFSDSRDPILFETMIFGGQYDQESHRYTTWLDAERVHKLAVQKVKGLLVK